MTIAAIMPIVSFAQAVEEVTVTATRKSESLQDIALSVQVLSGEEVGENKILNAQDLRQVIPGFDYVQGIGGGSAVSIRGLNVSAIGSATTEAGMTALNNHYVHPTVLGYIGFMDAENVQVLEGPQGTLYGRNSTTGIMNVITNKYGAGNNISVNAGQDGYGVLKFAYDLETGIDNMTARLAFQSKTKDGMVFNKQTNTDIDSRDASSGRLTLDWALPGDQSLSLMYEHHQADDSRFNLGTVQCHREAFYGCDPTKTGSYNTPYLATGTIDNTWSQFAQINRVVTAPSLGVEDYYANSATLAGDSIDEVRKTRNIQHAFDIDVVQLEHEWDIVDDVQMTTKYSWYDYEIFQTDDNSHSHPSSNLVWDLGPLVLGSAEHPMKFRCQPEQNTTNVVEAIDCQETTEQIDQFEINFVSDFDGPHNFTAGLYYFDRTAASKYGITTTAYAVGGDFRIHPMSDIVFAGALDGYSGTSFFQTMFGTIGQAAQGAIASQDTSNLSGLALAAAQGANQAIAAANTYGTALGTYAAAPTAANLTALQTAGAGIATLVKAANPTGSWQKIIPWDARGSLTDQRSSVETSAIFGEYYYDISDNTKLTLGARFMDDDYTSSSIGGLLDGASAYSSTSPDYETGWAESQTTSTGGGAEEMYKVAIQHFFAEDSMVYLSGTTGIRPGGIEPTGGKYDSEETLSVELGTKNILMDGRLKLNATYFSHETEGAQYSTIRGFSAYVEQQDFTNTGFQVQAEFALSDSTFLTMNALAIDSEMDGNNNVPDVINPTGMKSILGIFSSSTLSGGIDTFIAPLSAQAAAALKADANGNGTLDMIDACVAANAVCAAADFAITTSSMPSGFDIIANPLGSITCLTCIAALGNVGPDVYSQTGVNSSDAANAGLYAPSMQGNRLPGVSELDYNISVTQYFPVLDGVGSATVSFAHRGDFYTDIWNREAQKVDDADFIDIHTYYRPNVGDWYVSLWAKNIEDKRSPTSKQTGSPLQGGFQLTTFDEGMRAGLEFGLDF